MPESERRRAIRLGLLLFAVALAIRLWGLSWGLPEFFSGDEVTKRDTALHFLETGFVHPSDHPSFTYNTLFAIYSVANLFGDGWTLADYHYMGRLWMAVLGALTVVAVWRLGRRFDPTGRAGLAAAVFLAVLPLHTACSRYIKEDAPLGLAVTLTVLATLSYLSGPSRKRLALAAFLAGVTFSTKYTGGIVLLPVGIAFLVAAARERRPLPAAGVDLAALGAMFAVGFFAFSPIFLVHPGNLVEGLLDQGRYSLTGHDNIVANPWREWWTFYVRNGLIPGMTLPVFLLAGGGLWLLLKRRHGWFVVLMSLCLYLLVEQAKARPEPFPGRWLMPLVPLLCVAAGVAFMELASVLARRLPPALAYGALGALILVPPLVKTGLIADEALHDTRLIAGKWMEEHVPAGSTIVQTEGLQTLPASSYWQNRWRIDDRDVNHGIDASWTGPTPPYFVISSFKYQRFLDHPEAAPDRTRFYKTLREEYVLLREFHPRWLTYGRHSPVIRIYRPRLPEVAAR